MNNKNKILVNLSVPSIERSFDIFIPTNKKIGTVKSLIEDALIRISDNVYIKRDDKNGYIYFKINSVFYIKFMCWIRKTIS